MDYLFTSERLGFRNWLDNDFEALHTIISDEQVMRFFPKISSEEETWALMRRMQKSFEQNRFCYFAVERLDNQELLGILGMAEQSFEADFTPCVDIGWRLKASAWGKGYASEGAKKCLEYAFETIGLKEVVAMAPILNTPSIGVMRKVGMTYVKNFKHSKLKDYPNIEECALYRIRKQPE